MNRNLPQEFVDILKKRHISEPTHIQSESFTPLFDGENVVGLAKTGTGKTLAYLLPTILKTNPGDANATVIFEPTTELAIQTRDVAQDFVKAHGLKITALVGSGNRQRQSEVLKKKHPEVIVATPGRFFDLVAEKRIKINQIKHLILDEADDLLEETKQELLTGLVGEMEPTAQVSLFGATESAITKQAEELFGRKFQTIDVRNLDESKVEHRYFQVDNRHKIDIIKKLVKIENFRGILFFNSNSELDKFRGILSHTTIKFAELTGTANKEARKKALQSLENGDIKLLLTTDLTARGIDISNLTYVINFAMPKDKNTYLHRAGRTGRMGKKGRVITLGTDHDIRDLRKSIDDDFDLQRVYFDRYDLTTTKPKVEARITKAEQTEVENVVVSAPKKKKKKQKNQKNKGYHPLKDKKK